MLWNLAIAHIASHMLQCHNVSAHSLTCIFYDSLHKSVVLFTFIRIVLVEQRERELLNDLKKLELHKIHSNLIILHSRRVQLCR